MIYFIYDDSGYFKIGTADDPKKALEIFQEANPGELWLLRTIPGDESDKQAMHRLLRRYHARGEWFYSHDDVWGLMYKLAECAGEEKVAWKPHPREMTQEYVSRNWSEVIREVGREAGNVLSTRLRYIYLGFMHNNTLFLEPKPGYEDFAETCRSANSINKLETAFSKVLGRPMKVQYSVGVQRAIEGTPKATNPVTCCEPTRRGDC